jgi:hypothetical protein
LVESSVLSILEDWDWSCVDRCNSVIAGAFMIQFQSDSQD